MTAEKPFVKFFAPNIVKGKIEAGDGLISFTVRLHFTNLNSWSEIDIELPEKYEVINRFSQNQDLQKHIRSFVSDHWQEAFQEDGPLTELYDRLKKRYDISVKWWCHSAFGERWIPSLCVGAGVCFIDWTVNGMQFAWDEKGRSYVSAEECEKALDSIVIQFSKVNKAFGWAARVFQSLPLPAIKQEEEWLSQQEEVWEFKLLPENRLTVFFKRPDLKDGTVVADLQTHVTKAGGETWGQAFHRAMGQLMDMHRKVSGTKKDIST